MFNWLEKRRKFLVIVAILSVTFCGTLGVMKNLTDSTILHQQTESKAYAEKLDKQIVEVKAQKLAEQKAKAAEQKAASDAVLESQLQGNIVTPPGCAIKGAHGNPNQIDVVINKKHCFNPINFEPKDLVSYSGYVVSAKMLPDLTAMFTAASAASTPLSITSSYRSYVNQVDTYNNWVKVNGSTNAADTVSARPGYSEHQTGFAMDLSANGCSLECFATSYQYKWLQTNGATYGFIERYPAGLESVTGYSPEPWHWRYVGPKIALEMKAKGIKTLEQLWNITGGGY